MIEGGNGSRLALEAVVETFCRYVDRNVAVEPRVTGLEDFALAARVENPSMR
jgi:hypothetical protein